MIGGGLRALLLGLALVMVACASSAYAGGEDAREERCCEMSGVVRAIQVLDAAAANANAVSVHVGDIFFDTAGQVSVVTQRTPSTRGLLLLPAPYVVFNPAAAFVPGGSGAASITGTALANGLPAANAIIEVTLSATGNLTVGSATGTTEIKARVGNGTPNVLVRLMAQANGAFGFAFTGTATQTVTVSVVPVSPTGNAQSADGTLPA